MSAETPPLPWEEPNFDPGPHMVNLKNRGGARYLEVKWRIYWLRQSCRNAAIETEAVKLDAAIAIFKCTITIPKGGSATGYGSSKSEDFKDYVEKAETKSIGRALNVLGFGTQFAPEFLEPAPPRREVNEDGEVSYRRSGFYPPERAEEPAAPKPKLSDAQRKLIFALAREMNIDEDRLHELCKEHTPRPSIASLTRSEASEFIEALRERRSRTKV